jgi:hypothetical protein
MDRSTTKYILACGSNLAWQAAATAIRQPAPVPFTAKKIYVDLNTAPTGTNTYDLGLRKNDAETDLKVTIAGANTTSNYAEDISIDAGDLLCYSSAPTAPTAPYPGAAISVLGYIAPATTLKQMGGML